MDHKMALQGSHGAPHDKPISQLTGIGTVYPDEQERFYIVRLEPAVASKSDAVAVKNPRVRPTANRVLMGIQQLGYLRHRQQIAVNTRVVMSCVVDRG